EHAGSKNAVQRYEDRLRAAGETLSIADLQPPRVPADSNSADLFRQAMPLLVGLDISNLPPMKRMVAPGRAMVGWQQPDIRSDDATNSWAEEDRLVDARRPALELLRQVP